MQFQTVT